MLLTPAMTDLTRHPDTGKTLGDYHGIILDMCTLHVTLLPPGPRKPPDTFLRHFRDLLTMEGIRHRALAESTGLAKSTVKLLSADDMQQLVCKLPGRMRTVTRD